MAGSNYVFIRAEQPDSNWYANNADWTPLFAYDDPRLAQSIALAKQYGRGYGIWADPHGRSPEEYVALMAAMNQRYNPSVVVPDLEQIAKGYQGSAGWNYNQRVADLWRQQMAGVRTAITPMGNQSDFNYEAWKGIASEWLPQAYGADGTGAGWNPQQIIQTLIDRGVDPGLITPVLGTGNAAGYDGRYALWTADDFGMQNVLPNPGRNGAPATTVPAAARVTQSSAPRPQGRLSQSTSQVARSGLKWDGRTFQTPQQFNQYLRNNGSNWQTFVKKHPGAAIGLAQRVTRRPAATGRRG